MRRKRSKQLELLPVHRRAETTSELPRAKHREVVDALAELLLAAATDAIVKRGNDEREDLC